MNEDYVSYEVAKLLKEKGFDWSCQAFYNVNGMLAASPIHTINDEIEDSDIACPTLYIAQKWLREAKGIYIWVEPVVGHRWTVSFCDLNVCAEESDWIERELHKDGYPVYDSYEEVLNAGILEALKLI